MRKYDWVLVIAGVLFIAENIYFGWNDHALTMQEHVLDVIIGTLVIYAAFNSIANSVRPKVEVSIHHHTGKGTDLHVRPAMQSKSEVRRLAIQTNADQKLEARRKRARENMRRYRAQRRMKVQASK